MVVLALLGTVVWAVAAGGLARPQPETRAGLAVRPGGAGPGRSLSAVLPGRPPRRHLEPAPATPTPTATPSPTPTVTREPLVVSYYEQAEDTGYQIMSAGGNAFDAFVAVTAVENVLAPGTVTFSGLLSALVFDSTSGAVLSLDAGNNTVLDPQGVYSEESPVLGKLVAVPGVVGGLDALLTRHGRLTWAQVLQPAIGLARDGFIVDERYAYLVSSYAEVVQRTEYGRRTFFPNGRALRAGDRLRQPELAAFLEGIATHGATYMYAGEWAAQCVQTVREAGGLMTLDDLAAYRPTWTEPWRIRYREHDVFASSGKVMHGLWTLLALNTLGHTTLQPLGHFNVSPDALEVMVRVTRAVDEEGWIASCDTLDDLELVLSRLAPEYAAGIWTRVQAGMAGQAGPAPAGHHTLCSVTADREGNIVSGKHSVSSSWLWGTGLFVQGVSLNATGEMTERSCGPGARRTQGAPNLLALHNGAPRFACGVTGGSGPQTALQFLVNGIDYGLPVDEAVTRPRFGQYAYDGAGQIDLTRNELAAGFSNAAIAALEDRGLFFTIYPKVGNGCMAEFSSDGRSRGRWTR